MNHSSLKWPFKCILKCFWLWLLLVGSYCIFVTVIIIITFHTLWNTWRDFSAYTERLVSLNAISRHIVLMRTNVIPLWIVSQSTIFRLFSCYTERNVNQCILNTVTVAVRVRVRGTILNALLYILFRAARNTLRNAPHSFTFCSVQHEKSQTIVLWDTVQQINNVCAHERDMAWDQAVSSTCTEMSCWTGWAVGSASASVF